MYYPGRRFPLAVEAGERGEPPPLSVSHLSKGCIVLTGGRRVSGIGQFWREIPFVDVGKLWENDDLYCALIDLNRQGVPFQYQSRDMEAPDGLMAWWQETGRLKAAFREIAWRNPDEWFITTIEPPVLGIRGWVGPKPFGC